MTLELWVYQVSQLKVCFSPHVTKFINVAVIASYSASYLGSIILLTHCSVFTRAIFVISLRSFYLTFHILISKKFKDNTQDHNTK